MVAEAPSPADFLIVTQSQESKSEVCAQEFCEAMHIRTPLDNALYLSSLLSHLSQSELFFGSISKTNKTLVDDHVIAESIAGHMMSLAHQNVQNSLWDREFRNFSPGY